jgi:hypothetical protein
MREYPFHKLLPVIAQYGPPIAGIGICSMASHRSSNESTDRSIRFAKPGRQDRLGSPAASSAAL